MTIEKFIEKHCCSYGMHISEPCGRKLILNSDRKLILNSLYGRKATRKIKVEDYGEKKRV